MEKGGAHFELDKARVLGKADLSRKGSVDEPIRDLVEYINAHDSLYTTSSCSGRVTVFTEVCAGAPPPHSMICTVSSFIARL